jgi:DNA-directed RNA polymerase specialized sigma24 family protein
VATAPGPDPRDVEDILQDAFYESVVAARLIEPIRHAGAWLFTVIRNRVTDRRRQAGRVNDAAASLADKMAASRLLATDDDDESLVDLLPDPAAGPEECYARRRGLMALSWLLFGGWRGAGGFTGRHRRGGRHAMSAEERERFRAVMGRQSCR